MRFLTTFALILMLASCTVLAKEPDVVNYKIKIDKSQEYEDMLEKNRELFETLKGNKLFLNWLQRDADESIDGSNAYKKPSFDVNITKSKQEPDYIKCLEETNTEQTPSS